MLEHSPSPYSRKNPFPATIVANRALTLEGSGKETRHIELDLTNSGLTYEVGDSLGVFPSNDPALVEALLANLGFSGAEEIALTEGTTLPIREALLKHFSLAEPSKQFLEAVVARDPAASSLAGLLGPEARPALMKYLHGQDILDFLEKFPAARFAPEELAAVLRKLLPRLYSVASSQKVVGASAHLTLAMVRYTPNGGTRLRKGVCTTFLAERASAPGAVPVFVHSAKHFRLPEDPGRPIIMVGPGTGIAAFRAFLQERGATGATGKNWLFFGEQHVATDFLYKEDIETWQAAGLLTKFHAAFSRDQDHKIYVQDRMLGNAREIYDWLEEGAYFYVCGDAHRMAKDVDAALHKIIAEVGGRTPEEATEYVTALRTEKRYRKDVY